jgi:fumarylacetoacetate (FAA) hydrolase
MLKVASLKAGGRDGTLVVVSRDLKSAVKVTKIASTLQAALDHWDTISPRLQSIYQALNNGEIQDTFPLDFSQLASPLPRAYQWADGSAYLNHAELVRKARGAEMPERLRTDPLTYQGGSDGFLGPFDPIPTGSEDWGIDFEAEVAVITDDVPMGVTPEETGKHIKLIMLVNDVSLRNLIPGELEKGFGFFHGKPASAFSPVAVSPDELGKAWDGHKLNLPLFTWLNSKQFGNPDAGVDLSFDFPTLIVHAAKTRSLGAGTIIGSGTVSNRDRSRGSSCLAERRMIEIIEKGAPSTPFMRFGDRVRIEMFDSEGRSIFGPIDQQVIKYEGPK